MFVKAANPMDAMNSGTKTFSKSAAIAHGTSTVVESGVPSSAQLVYGFSISPNGGRPSTGREVRRTADASAAAVTTLYPFRPATR